MRQQQKQLMLKKAVATPSRCYKVMKREFVCSSELLGCAKAIGKVGVAEVASRAI